MSAQPSAYPALVLDCITWGLCTERKGSALEKSPCGSCVCVSKVGYQHISPASLFFPDSVPNVSFQVVLLSREDPGEVAGLERTKCEKM